VIKDNDVISTFFVVVEGEGDVLYNNETCSYVSIGLTFTLRTGKKEKRERKTKKKFMVYNNGTMMTWREGFNNLE